MTAIAAAATAENAKIVPINGNKQNITLQGLDVEKNIFPFQKSPSIFQIKTHLCTFTNEECRQIFERINTSIVDILQTHSRTINTLQKDEPGNIYKDSPGDIDMTGILDALSELKRNTELKPIFYKLINEIATGNFTNICKNCGFPVSIEKIILSPESKNLCRHCVNKHNMLNYAEYKKEGDRVKGNIYGFLTAQKEKNNIISPAKIFVHLEGLLTHSDHNRTYQYQCRGYFKTNDIGIKKYQKYYEENRTLISAKIAQTNIQGFVLTNPKIIKTS